MNKKPIIGGGGGGAKTPTVKPADVKETKGPAKTAEPKPGATPGIVADTTGNAVKSEFKGGAVHQVVQQTTAAPIVSGDLYGGGGAPAQENGPMGAIMGALTSLQLQEGGGSNPELTAAISAMKGLLQMTGGDATRMQNIGSLAREHQEQVVYGTVIATDPANHTVTMRKSTGDTITGQLLPTTWFDSIQNLDGEWRDRFPNVPGSGDGTADKINKYLKPGQQAVIYATTDEGRVTITNVKMPGSKPGSVGWQEDADWYPKQIRTLGETWLDMVVQGNPQPTQAQVQEGFATWMASNGVKIGPQQQQSAHLSRVAYGLSAAFRVTGDDRLRMLAKAMVEWTEQTHTVKMTPRRSADPSKFSYDNHKLPDDMKDLKPSSNRYLWRSNTTREEQAPGVVRNRADMKSLLGDDPNAISIYEQIYTLAAQTEYYAGTFDPSRLKVIEGTIDAMLQYFYNPELKGFYSHIDPVDLSPSSEVLGMNRDDFNWNSMGDHLPAYLFGLMTALGPSTGKDDPNNRLRDKAEFILKVTTDQIATKFPQITEAVMRERFNAAEGEWKNDTNAPGWLRDGGVVGHNLKVVWNMGRAAFALEHLAKQYEKTDPKKSAEYLTIAEHARTASKSISDKIGSFAQSSLGETRDVVERNQDNGLQLTYGPKVAFWQQEQQILAWLTATAAQGDSKFVPLADTAQMYWNLAHLNQRTGLVNFETLHGRGFAESNQGSRPDMGMYHAGELDKHTEEMLKTYVTGELFQRSFKIPESFDQKSIHVLPDFVPEGALEVAQVRIGNRELSSPDDFDGKNFRLDIGKLKGDQKGELDITVTYRPTGKVRETWEAQAAQLKASQPTQAPAEA